MLRFRRRCLSPRPPRSSVHSGENVFSAELKGPRNFDGSGLKSPIRAGFGRKVGPKPCPKYQARYPQTGTQRFRTILGRFRRVDDDPKMLNCEIAQPSLVGLACKPELCVSVSRSVYWWEPLLMNWGGLCESHTLIHVRDVHILP